ncbi:unnamed protein product, partial [Rotaria sp. Silwood2]
MNEIHSLLKLTVFEYNKEKCIRRILDPMFNDAVSSLRELLASDINNVCQNVTIGEVMTCTPDHLYLIEQNISLKEYISILFNWVKRIVSIRESMKNDKYNINLNTIENFQECCELLYYSETFRSILSFE